MQGRSDCKFAGNCGNRMTETRKSVRCSSCDLVQFERPACLRCHKSLLPDSPPTVKALPHLSIIPPAIAPDPAVSPSWWLGIVVAYLRTKQGLSQAQLTTKIGTPRTWMTKIENGNTIPNFHSLIRLADSLETSPYWMLRLAELCAGGRA
jgi:DNA-binding XRE family transcriptional regulator